jgi:hypothetical protein
MYYGLVPVPASQETIVCYVAHLARTLAPVSVGIYLNVVRILHEESGVSNPLRDNYELLMIKRGLRRLKGLPPKQKAPMTIAILLKLHSTIDFSLSVEKAFWATILIGFFGFLRKSSFLPESTHTPSSKRLDRGDVSDLSLESFNLTCRHSKTIQYGQRVHVIPFASCVDKRICPVFGLMSHLGVSPLGSDAPLFSYVQSGVEHPYTHASFVARLKLGITRCGLDSSRASCHSF